MLLLERASRGSATSRGRRPAHMGGTTPLRPASARSALGQISGVGAKKLEAYGSEILRVLEDHSP